MKVLLVSSDNSDRSGAFLSMCNLAYFLKINHKVDCRVLLPFEGTGTRILDDYGIKYKIIRTYDWIIPVDCGTLLSNIMMRVKKYIKYAINMINAPKIDKYIEEFNPDIVHINTICTYVCAVSAKKYNIPLVWHIREFLEEDWNNRLHFRSKGYSLVSSADQIICISQSIKDKFNGILDNKNIDVILNGVRKDKYINEEHVTGNLLNIVCVGGLFPHKGQEILIRATRIVKDKFNGLFHVYILGTGPCLKELVTLTNELALDDVISFEGYQEDTETYYREADISIVPSYFEPFGRVTVEAMMCGTFVIGTDTAGTKELIGNDKYGYLFKCGDYEDLSKKMLDIMNNPQKRNETIEKAIDFSRSELSAEKNAQNIYLVYEKLIYHRKTNER